MAGCGNVIPLNEKKKSGEGYTLMWPERRGTAPATTAEGTMVVRQSFGFNQRVALTVITITCAPGHAVRFL